VKKYSWKIAAKGNENSKSKKEFKVKESRGGHSNIYF
jgi:hypothetical protein